MPGIRLSDQDRAMYEASRAKTDNGSWTPVALQLMVFHQLQLGPLERARVRRLVDRWLAERPQRAPDVRPTAEMVVEDLITRGKAEWRLDADGRWTVVPVSGRPTLILDSTANTMDDAVGLSDDRMLLEEEAPYRIVARVPSRRPETLTTTSHRPLAVAIAMEKLQTLPAGTTLTVQRNLGTSQWGETDAIQTNVVNGRPQAVRVDLISPPAISAYAPEATQLG